LRQRGEALGKRRDVSDTVEQSRDGVPGKCFHKGGGVVGRLFSERGMGWEKKGRFGRKRVRCSGKVGPWTGVANGGYHAEPALSTVNAGCLMANGGQ